MSELDRQAVRRALWDFPDNVISLADLDAKADADDLDYAETREYLDRQADAVLALLRGEPTAPEPWQHEGHKPTQHRDGKPPWCNTCGWSSPIRAVPAALLRGAS